MELIMTIATIIGLTAVVAISASMAMSLHSSSDSGATTASRIMSTISICAGTIVVIKTILLFR